MMENADEYWAEGVQTWFDATVRTDVNSGINTRDKLKAHDPGFAALLAEVGGMMSCLVGGTQGQLHCSAWRQLYEPDGHMVLAGVID